MFCSELVSSKTLLPSGGLSEIDDDEGDIAGPSAEIIDDMISYERPPNTFVVLLEDEQKNTIIFRPYLMMRTVLEKICVNRGMELQKMLVRKFPRLI